MKFEFIKVNINEKIFYKKIQLNELKRRTVLKVDK